MKNDNGVAIIGMACRIPAAKTVGNLWENLLNGVNAITKVPPDRWDAEAFHNKDFMVPGTIPTTQAGFVSDIHLFDNSFFHISPQEAEAMDPQHRHMLELTYEALESAGISKSAIAGTQTGVFVGICSSEYSGIQITEYEAIKPYFALGSALSITANRVSYTFDLHGPSFIVDTACSSSLVALHLAAESIRKGECSTAIVGGLNAMVSPVTSFAFSRANMLSPDGKCKAFDASADGFVRGEGFCVLVLRSLDEALKNNDPIRAIIKGNATNQDGKTPGITTPGLEAQKKLLQQLYSKSGVSSAEVQYVEAHGTGTAVGDPIEATAIGEILGKEHSESNPLYVGSIKTNIGHLEGASGLAGVIKAVLTLENGIIPANLHFQEPNPAIDFSGLNLVVPIKNIACPLKYVGVNSFGFGGSNAHIILERASAEQRSEIINEEYYPFLLSAHTKDATSELVIKFRDYLAKNEIDQRKLRDIAYTLCCRRSRFPFNASVVAHSKKELIEQLGTANISKNNQCEKLDILFVFAGQGAQYFAMGRELLKNNQVFQETMQLCNDIIMKQMGWSLLEELAKSEQDSLINRPDISQPACTALQICLVKVWEAYGVRPSVVVGHSSGEIAAAFCAGLLSLEAAMLCAIFRGTALRDAPFVSEGKMIAVSLSEQEAKELLSLAEFQNKVCIAAVNSPSNITLSGDVAEIDTISKLMLDRGVNTQTLRTGRAYHSHHMKPVQQLLQHLCKSLPTLGKANHIPMISTVTACLLNSTDSHYWGKNLVEPVQFASAIQAACDIGFNVIIEIGPHPVLTGPIRECLSTSNPDSLVPILPSIRRNEPEMSRILLSLIILSKLAPMLQLDNLFQDAHVVADLPQLPWQSKPFWSVNEEIKLRNFPKQQHELLGIRSDLANDTFLNSLSLRKVPYLSDHKVQGDTIFPGAGYVAMMVAASGEKNRVGLENVMFQQILILDEFNPTKTQVVVSPSAMYTQISIYTKQGDQWQRHSEGQLTKIELAQNIVQDFSSFEKIYDRYFSGDEFTKMLHSIGFQYGPEFSILDELWVRKTELYATISSSKSALAFKESYLLHPTILDAAFQTIAAFLIDLRRSSCVYLPAFIGKISIFNPCHDTKFSLHVKCTSKTIASLIADLYLYNSNGVLCCQINQFKLIAISGSKLGPTLDNTIYEPVWAEDFSLMDLQEILIAKEADSLIKAQIDYEYGFAISIFHSVYNSIMNSNSSVVPQRKQFFNWIQNFVKSSSIPSTLTPCPESNASITMIQRVAAELENILTGKLDPISVFFADSTVEEMYDEVVKITYHHLCTLVPYLVHKNPTADILEIGTGTGGFTKSVLRVLDNNFTTFTCTDISTVLLETTKHKFMQYGDKMLYKKLNIEVDPISQEFAENKYDILLAMNVVHATRDIADSLTHMLKLLKPEGTLILVEITNSIPALHLMLGVLDGWWLYTDKSRRFDGPLVNDEGWKEVLHFVGFTDITICPDVLAPYNIHSFIVAKKPGLLPHVQWHIVPNSCSQLPHTLATALTEKNIFGNIIDEASLETPNVIFLPSLIPFLGDGAIETIMLDKLKQVNSVAKQIIWVVSGTLMEVSNSSLAPIIGLIRVLRNETEKNHTIIDLDPSASEAEKSLSILKILQYNSLENEFAVRNNKIYIYRLQPITTHMQEEITNPVNTNSNARMEVRNPGLLSSVQWVSKDRKPQLEPDEVEIRVISVGIVFRDVMTALNLIESPVYGNECSGFVTRVGSNVAFKVGDKVIACNCYAASIFVVVSKRTVWLLPAMLSFDEAAAMPINFATAAYGLHELAKLKRGEKVLIHAAAGGVGNAAIQISKLIGAEIFVTVGSNEKRKYIQDEFQIPADHIMNSRTLEFADTLIALGGVDVVLNSLSGHFLSKSLSVLKQFGRFVEIGKRDFMMNSTIGTKPFENCLSFFSVDLLKLKLSQLDQLISMVKNIISLFESKKLKPPPLTILPFSKIEEAFRIIQSGKHIGKVILSIEKTPLLKIVSVPNRLTLKSTGIYLILGGTGGLGRFIAKWLALIDATNIAIISRTGASTPATSAWVQSFNKSFPCVNLAVEAADVCDYSQLASAIQSIRKHFNNLPFYGVFNMVMVLNNNFFDNVTPEIFNTVASPKIKGTQNIESLVSGPNLDFFVMFSSLTSIVGIPRQSNYASGNTYLDALAHERRNQNLPFISLNLGPIAEFGYVAESEEAQNFMKRLGLSMYPSQLVIDALEYFLVTNNKAQVVFTVQEQHQRMTAVLPQLCSPQFSAILKKKEFILSSENQLQRNLILASKDRNELFQKLVIVIKEKLGGMLSVAPEDINPSVNILELGVDSLMGIEIRNWAVRELNVVVVMSEVAGGKSINDIAEILCDKLNLFPEQKTVIKRGAYICFKECKQPKHVLVCFPYFNGTASCFDGFKTTLPEDVEMWVSNPTVGLSWDGLMTELTSSDILDSQVPITFYGHSAGAIVAYILALRLKPKISRLIVGGCFPPSKDTSIDKYSNVGSQNVGYGGFKIPNEKFNGPIYAIRGNKDTMVSQSGMEGWSGLCDSFSLHEIDGDHLFIHNQVAVEKTIQIIFG